MGLHRDIESLQPLVQQKARLFLERCRSAGLRVRITETLRTPETQAVYYLRGRVDTSDPNIVKALQILGAAHAWPFSDAEVAQRVTWTLDSNHLDGNAFDIAIVDVRGRTVWDYNHPDWQRAIEIARNIGFECGADWVKKDYPHIEWIEK